MIIIFHSRAGDSSEKSDFKDLNTFTFHPFSINFNAELSLDLYIPGSQNITVFVCNVQGSVNARLWQSWMNGGLHRLNWSDLDAPSGLYLVQVTGDGWNYMRKVLLLK